LVQRCLRAAGARWAGGTERGRGQRGWVRPGPWGRAAPARLCPQRPAAGARCRLGLEQPRLHPQGPAQPGSALAVLFNQATEGAARELWGVRVGSAGVGGGCDHLPAVSSQGGQGCLGREKSLSKKVLSLPLQQRLCLQRGGSEEGARIGSVSPAAPGRAPEPQDPSPPSLPYPRRCLPPPLASPQPGAFNYSCPPVADSLRAGLGPPALAGKLHRLPSLPAPEPGREPLAFPGRRSPAPSLHRSQASVSRASGAEGLKAGGSGAPAPRGAALLLSHAPQ